MSVCWLLCKQSLNTREEIWPERVELNVLRPHLGFAEAKKTRQLAGFLIHFEAIGYSPKLYRAVKP